MTILSLPREDRKVLLHGTWLVSYNVNSFFVVEVLVRSVTEGMSTAVVAWLTDRFGAIEPHKNLDPDLWSDNVFLCDHVLSIKLCEIEGMSGALTFTASLGRRTQQPWYHLFGRRRIHYSCLFPLQVQRTCWLWVGRSNDKSRYSFALAYCFSRRSMGFTHLRKRCPVQTPQVHSNDIQLCWLAVVNELIGRLICM